MTSPSSSPRCGLDSDLPPFSAPATAITLGKSADPQAVVLIGDARRIPLPDNSVDLVVTSPPYWKKRDYGLPNQIGQEETADEYAKAILSCLT